MTITHGAPGLAIGPRPRSGCGVADAWTVICPPGWVVIAVGVARPAEGADAEVGPLEDMPSPAFR
jgi:hypothetical protein